MKAKIFAALKTAYAKLGLSDEAFDGVASLLSKTVTEESQIATAIGGDDVVGLLKTIQGQVDSWKNKYHDKSKEMDAYKAAHPEKPAEPPTAPQNEEPEWARKLREQNEEIIAEQNRVKAAEKQRQSETNVKAALEKAGCTNPGILRLTMKGFALGENETEEQAVTRLTADYNQNVKDAFGDGNIPPIGAGVPTADPHQVAEEMNAILEQNGLLPPKE